MQRIRMRVCVCAFVPEKLIKSLPFGMGRDMVYNFIKTRCVFASAEMYSASLVLSLCLFDAYIYYVHLRTDEWTLVFSEL